MAAAKARPLIALVALIGGASVYFYVTDRRTFAADVRAICSSEAGAETTIVSGRIVVEGLARKSIHGADGRSLLDAMKSSPPDIAAAQLRTAAEKTGVAECRAVASYQALAARVALQRSATRLCSSMDPTALAKVPRAARFGRLAAWAHESVADPALDALLAPLAAGTLDESTARLRAALSNLDIHACGLLAGLASPLDPAPGANVLVQSIAVQNDAREPEIAADLRAKIPAFRACYEAGLATNPKLAGTMSIKFRLTETGALDFALVQDDSTLIAPVVTSCMVEAVKSAHGPPGPSKNPGGIIMSFWVAS